MITVLHWARRQRRYAWRAQARVPCHWRNLIARKRGRVVRLDRVLALGTLSVLGTRLWGDQRSSGLPIVIDLGKQPAKFLPSDLHCRSLRERKIYTWGGGVVVSRSNVGVGLPRRLIGSARKSRLGAGA